MSKPDRVVDLDHLDGRHISDMTEVELQEERPDDIGLLLIYPISKNSVPMGASRKVDSRKPIDAVMDVIGVGMVFPESRRATEESPSYEYDYVAVRLPDEDPLLEEEDEVDPEQLDTEVTL
jgi:hypothetical protein